jgi:hypothetical protein
MVGILVHGDNHFIVRGPLPDRETALALVQHWSIIQIGTHIGTTTPAHLAQWSITSREFRENLEWAVIVPGDGEMSGAVTELLGELAARGIVARKFSADTA